MISLLLQLWCTEAVAEEVDEQPKLSFEELGWVPPFQVAGDVLGALGTFANHFLLGAMQDPKTSKW